MRLLIEKLSFMPDRYNEKPEVFLPMVRQGDLYKKLYEDIKKNGIINPFLIVKEGNIIKCATGNIRLIVCKDLGIEEVECIEIPEYRPDVVRKYKELYYEKLDGYEVK